MKRKLRLPSPAMVVACLALLIALGGTSYAAIRIPANSVGTKQLKKNAVTSPKVKNNSITGADVLESSLGQVPSAANAGHATSADSATNATTATNATNANHAAAADSATSATTAANVTGLDGPLAAGKTLTGAWAIAGHKVNAGDFVSEGAITFAVPLPSAPAFNFIPPGGASTAQCPGSFAAPAAAAGQLCFYANFLTGATGLTAASGSPSKFGSTYFSTGVAAGANYEVGGRWAVTSAGSAFRPTPLPRHAGQGAH